MITPRIAALTLGFILSLTAFSQSAFERRRLDVYFHPQEYVQDTVVRDFQDAYLKSTANYLVGRFALAERQLNHAEQWKADASEEELLNFYLMKCKIFRGKGQYMFALDALNNANELATASANPSWLGKVYVEYIEHLRATVQFEEAEQYISLLQGMESELEPETRIRFWHRSAAVYVQKGDVSKPVVDLLKKAIRWSDSLNFPWHSASANLDLGYIYYNTHQDNPRPYFWRAYKLTSGLGHIVDESTALHNLARMYEVREQYDSSMACLNKMYKPALANSWISVQADVWDIRATVYLALANYDSAMASFYLYHDLKMLDIVNAHSREGAELAAKLGAASARNALLVSENERFQTSQLLFQESRAKKIYIGMTALLAALTIGIVYLFLQQKKNVDKLIVQGEEIEKVNVNLTTALEQKDLIYMELHHRVKNNLANLSGLLYLQEKSIRSKEAKLALSETRQRIQAMALIHRGLYQTDDLVLVEMQSNLEDLMPNLLSVYEDRASNVVPEVKCEALKVGVDDAVHLSMIINELVTNSLKYAFMDVKKGVLRLEGGMVEGGWFVRVIDNGPGMPPDFNWSETKSLGLYLVRVLSEEIGATFKYTREEERSIFTITHVSQADE